MEADRPIDVVVAFGGEEKKLDTAGRLLPLVSDDCLHNVALRFLFLGQHGRGAIPGLQQLACTTEEFLIGDEIPVGMLILEFDFHKLLVAAEIDNRPLKGGLHQAFDRPGLAALRQSTCRRFERQPGRRLW